MKYTKYILSIVIPFGFMYLIGVWSYGSFSLLDWTCAGRVLTATFASLISIYFIMHNIALDMSKTDLIDVNDIWVYDAKIVDK